jgi:hypothetical protein
MGFDKEPDFNIHLDGEVFFNHHPLFDEVFDKECCCGSVFFYHYFDGIPVGNSLHKNG